MQRLNFYYYLSNFQQQRPSLPKNCKNIGSVELITNTNKNKQTKEIPAYIKYLDEYSFMDIPTYHLVTWNWQSLLLYE